MSVLLNFPHQVNRIEKIHAALQCVSQLIENGRDPLDDGELGFLAARNRIYNFRGMEDSSLKDISKRIIEEKKKPMDNQGPRTFARDLRRTLTLMGLVSEERGLMHITPIAERMLRFSPGDTDPEYLQLWKDAVLHIRMGKFNVSPAQRILQLLDESQGELDKAKLALALFDEPDTPALMANLLQKARDKNFEIILKGEGITEFQAANAIKILPAILQQVGLIEISDGRCALLLPGRNSARGIFSVIKSTIKQKRDSRRRKPQSFETAQKISSEADIPSLERGSPRITEDSIQQALLALGYRTEMHQVLLKALVSNLKNVSRKWATQSAYDLLAKSALRKEWLLFECKTGINTRAQSRLALGQLCAYEYFDVRPRISTDNLLKVAVFDREPGEEMRAFLSAYGSAVISIAANAIVVPPVMKEYF